MRKAQSYPKISNGHFDIMKQPFKIKIVSNNNKENINPNFFWESASENDSQQVSSTQNLTMNKTHFLDLNENKVDSTQIKDLENFRKISFESWEEHPCIQTPNEFLAGNGFSFGGKFNEKEMINESVESLKRISLMTNDTFPSENSSLSFNEQDREPLRGELEEGRVLRDVTHKYVSLRRKSEKHIGLRKKRRRRQKALSKMLQRGVLRM